VPDYAKLADIARERQEAERLVSERHKQLRPDPCSFFEQVKAHLMNGMEKANVELRRRGVALLGRNHLPGFDDEVFLTYGTDTLCRVGLGFLGGGCRITAVISGPPSGFEISRKEYFCSQEAACKEVSSNGEGGLPVVVPRPDQVAADIIKAILFGRFF
jgi:hypothetical protein